MEARWPRPLIGPLALGLTGGAFAVLAVIDKVFGLLHQPFYLATLAYLCLFTVLAWAFFRGIPVNPGRPVRPSFYTAFLILNVLTAAYVFAWRLSADPTPVVLEQELAQGDARLKEGDKDGAFLLYQDAYRRFPQSFPVLMRLGAVNYRIGDFERARKYYSRAVEVAAPSNRWHALNDLGQSYWKLQRPAEAIRYDEQARDAAMPASDVPEWHYRVGWAYFDLHNYDAAIEHYQAVVDAGRKFVSASYYNIACAQAQKLKLTRARPVQALVKSVVEHLRLAWQTAETDVDREALRKGLLGAPDERDPDLAPLRSSPELAAFLREIH